MHLLKLLETFPLRKCGASSFRESVVQPFCGFKDAVERSVKRLPYFNITIPISIEDQPDSVAITLVSRQCDEVCRRELDVDKCIEEIGPFYLQIKR